MVLHTMTPDYLLLLAEPRIGDVLGFWKDTRATQLTLHIGDIALDAYFKGRIGLLLGFIGLFGRCLKRLTLDLIWPWHGKFLKSDHLPFLGVQFFDFRISVLYGFAQLRIMERGDAG